MSDTPNWSFETRQIHVGQEQADPATGARPADLPDDELRLQRHGPREEPFRPVRARQHLHADHEPDSGRGREAARLPRGWRRRAPAQLRNVGDVLLDHQHRPGRRSRRGEPALYGGTYNLFQNTLPKLGIEVTFVEDAADPVLARRSRRTPSSSSASPSPTRRTSWTSRLSPPSRTTSACRFVVDNTIATPYLLRPIEHGADIVVRGDEVPRRPRHDHRRRHRRLGQLRLRRRPRPLPELQPARPELPRPRLRARPGQGRRIRRQPRLHPQGSRPAAPRPGQRHLAVQRLPHRAGHRDPQPRIDRHLENAHEVAAFLQGHDQVERVIWASLPGDPNHGAPRSTSRRAPARCSPSRSRAGSRRARSSSRA